MEITTGFLFPRLRGEMRRGVKFVADSLRPLRSLRMRIVAVPEYSRTGRQAASPAPD
jgi:hypothetical protein